MCNILDAGIPGAALQPFLVPGLVVQRPDQEEKASADQEGKHIVKTGDGLVKAGGGPHAELKEAEQQGLLLHPSS